MNNNLLNGYIWYYANIRIGATIVRNNASTTTNTTLRMPYSGNYIISVCGWYGGVGVGGDYAAGDTKITSTTGTSINMSMRAPFAGLTPLPLQTGLFEVQYFMNCAANTEIQIFRISNNSVIDANLVSVTTAVNSRVNSEAGGSSVTGPIKVWYLYP